MRRSKRKVSLSAEMPQFKPKPAPQATRTRASRRNCKSPKNATSSAGMKGRMTTRGKSKNERNGTALIRENTPESEDLTSESEELTFESEVPKTRVDAKTEAKDPTLTYYVHHTERLVTFLSFLKTLALT